MRVLMFVVDITMFAAVIAGAVYSASSRQPPHRRRIAQRVVVLALAVVLAGDAITSPRLRWFNVGVVVFSVGAILVQVCWERRRNTP